MHLFLDFRGSNVILSLNNGPFAGHSDLESDGRYFCSGFPLMVSWWVQYLAKGPRPDFNNGPWDNLKSGRILGSRRLFETDLNNGLSPGHSSLKTLKKITTTCTIASLLILLFFPSKCSEASFKRAQSP